MASIFIPPISLPQIFKRKKTGRAGEYDYPAPILDPELEKKQRMVRIKTAYAQGFHGTNHEIPDGSADDILRGQLQGSARASGLGRLSPPVPR